MIRTLALVGALSLATAAAAAPKAAGLEARAAWSRPAVAGMTGVGYLTLVNHTAGPAVLIGAQSPLATHAQAHRAWSTGGVAHMAAEPRVEIPAGGKVVFAPGGRHLMFEGLKKGLGPGDTLPATLIFADGRKLSVRFAVGDGSGPPH